MFSARLDWNLRPNRLSQALQDKRRRRVSILDLSESNPTRAALHYPAEEILRALADPTRRGLCMVCRPPSTGRTRPHSAHRFHQ